LRIAPEFILGAEVLTAVGTWVLHCEYESRVFRTLFGESERK